jgi:hypothetical protein
VVAGAGARGAPAGRAGLHGSPPVTGSEQLVIPSPFVCLCVCVQTDQVTERETVAAHCGLETAEVAISRQSQLRRGLHK